MKINFLKFILNYLEPDLQHVFNLFCDFGGDLMTRSEKNKCIYVQNLQWKSMGK